MYVDPTLRDVLIVPIHFHLCYYVVWIRIRFSHNDRIYVTVSKMQRKNVLLNFFADIHQKIMQ